MRILCLFLKEGAGDTMVNYFIRKKFKNLINPASKAICQRWSCIFKTIYKWGKAWAAASSTLKLSEGEQIIYKCQRALPGKHAVYTQWTPGEETPHLLLTPSLMRRLFGNEKIVYHLHSHTKYVLFEASTHYYSHQECNNMKSQRVILLLIKTVSSWTILRNYYLLRHCLSFWW